MNIGDSLTQFQQLLLKSGITTAQLDSEIMISDEFGKDKTWVLAHKNEELTDSQIANLRKLVNRRAKHEPIAYIRGKQEFYRRDFFVTPDTLTPRPETETMITLALAYIRQNFSNNKEFRVTDIGTGSGCIAVTMALELDKDHKAKYIGLDISSKALSVARKNASLQDVNIKFMQFDLTIDSLPDISPTIPQILMCNLPYVPDDFNINLAASHEPRQSIFGGKDGLDYYKRLFELTKPLQNTVIFTEALPLQHQQLQAIANSNDYSLFKSSDFIQIFLKT